VVETDLPAYGRRVLPWLERDPIRNTVQATVLVTLLEGATDPGDPWLAWLRGGSGEVAGVALRTPPRGLLVSPLPAGAPEALAAVAEPGLRGAAGPAAEAEAFATAYAARTGARAAAAIRQRLFRLDRLVPPPPAAGRLREATAADVELGSRWYAEFAAEAHMPLQPDVAGATGRAVAQRRLLLWEVGGEPVSMVAHSPPVAGVPRVGPVYTPPEHRRRGYAAAATAGTCERLFRAGARTIVLFADRANPTSTGVYRRIGFHPVAARPPGGAHERGRPPAPVRASTDHDDWVLEY